jgi:hypothetical protein
MSRIGRLTNDRDVLRTASAGLGAACRAGAGDKMLAACPLQRTLSHCDGPASVPKTYVRRSDIPYKHAAAVL